MQDFRQLYIYKRSIEYCAEIYRFLEQLPKTERYGITSQIRRASSSIALNISEGAGTISKKEFSIFISYAYRSVNEVLTCLELIKKLALSKQHNEIKDLESTGVELSRMLYSFFKTLRSAHKL